MQRICGIIFNSKFEFQTIYAELSIALEKYFDEWVKWLIFLPNEKI